MITTLPNENADAYEITRTYKNALDKIISFYFGESALIPDGFLKFLIIIILTAFILFSFATALIIMLEQIEPKRQRRK